MFENKDNRPRRDESQSPLVTVREQCVAMCKEAAAATDDMQYGRAMRTIEHAIRMADDAPWIDGQGMLVRSVVRESGARLAVIRGDFAEAVTLFGEAAAIRAQIFGPESKETQRILAMKAESLADLGQLHESLVMWNEIVEWADSEHGTPLAKVSTRLSRARVLYRVGLEEASMQEVSAALELMRTVPAERVEVLVDDLLDQAGKFEKVGDFTSAYALMKAAVSMMEARLGGTPADAVELEAFRLELAELASGAGLEEVARSLQQNLLRHSAVVKGDGHPDTMDIRESVAVTAFERGDFATAELHARRNFELAIQDPANRDLLQRGLTLNWLYEKMGRLRAAHTILHEMHGVLGEVGSVPSTPESVESSHLVNVGELVRGLRNGVDLHELLDQTIPEMPIARRFEVKAGLLTAMATALVESHGDIPLAEEVLGEVDSIILALPQHLQETVVEDAQKARIAIAVATHNYQQEVSLKELQVERFQQQNGLGRGVTYASLLGELADAYHRAGDNRAAFSRLKEAQLVLRHFGATKSFLYGRMLKQKADVLPAWDSRVERYRERAERILRRFAGE
jgi:tetratricopeptide (TPR) repeat protein